MPVKERAERRKGLRDFADETWDVHDVTSTAPHAMTAITTSVATSRRAGREPA
jgi:hypothetical protein